MELTEAAKRILWHVKLILICMGLGLLIPLVILPGHHPNYLASTRVVASDQNTGTTASDTVAAIATSPTQVQLVLSSLGMHRSASSVALETSVRPIGSSGVVQLSVSDRDPAVATTLANALTDRLVEVMRNSGLATYPLPHVVSFASASTTVPVSAKRSQDVALGAVIGLFLGVLAAAFVEALNPTVIGKDALAAELGAPVLGVLPGPPGSIAPKDLSWTLWQLGARAKLEHVDTVELTTAGPSIDLLPLSEALVTAGIPRVNGSILKIRTLDPTDTLSAYSQNGSAGLVVVTPATIKRAEIGRAKDLVRVTGWPSVGVIAYRPDVMTRSWRWLTGGVASVTKAARSRNGEGVSGSNGSEMPHTSADGPSRPRRKRRRPVTGRPRR